MWELDNKKDWVLKNWCFQTVELEKTLESPLDKKSNQSILKEINPEYSLEGLMLKLWYFGHLMQRADSLEKTLKLGKIEGRREGNNRGWYHQLHWHEFEQTPRDNEGQGSTACCSPWGCRVRHDWGTEQQQQQCMCFGGRLLFSFTHKKVKPTLECLSLNPKFPLEGVPWWLR